MVQNEWSHIRVLTRLDGQQLGWCEHHDKPPLISRTWQYCRSHFACNAHSHQPLPSWHGMIPFAANTTVTEWSQVLLHDVTGNWMIPSAVNALQWVVNGRKTTKLPLPLDISSPCWRRPSHGYRQHAQKLGKDSACGSTDTLAVRLTNTHTRCADHNTSPLLPWAKQLQQLMISALFSSVSYFRTYTDANMSSVTEKIIWYQQDSQSTRNKKFKYFQKSRALTVFQAPKLSTWSTKFILRLASTSLSKKTRMWANAQRDGHPAEYRRRPLFNAAVWLTPTTSVVQ